MLRFDERAEHRNDLIGTLLRSRVLVRRSGRAQQCDQFAPQRLSICFGHAEELTDHRERKGKRKRGDEIDAGVGPSRGDAVEQVVDD